MGQKITIYTKHYCPYCRSLVKFLNKSKIEFTEIDVSENTKLHQEVIKKTGHLTVPAVFVDKKFIGGSEDFYEWFSKNS